MTTDQLTREEAVDDLRTLDHEVALAARTELRYHAMQADIDGGRAGRTLRGVLRALDIDPFTLRSVKQYQWRMAHSRTWWAATLTAVAVCVGCIYYATTVWPLGIVPGVFSGVLAIGLLCGIGRGQWRDVPLEGCHLVVPTFALETALRIHRSMPTASIRVEYLIPGRDVIKGALDMAQQAFADPFLVVSAGDYRAYVEVWDEPRFDATRTA
jgi:hypothetical protein